MKDPQEAEVEWYKKYGVNKNLRITRDMHGRPYVIGDWYWNRDRRYSGMREVIEPSMAQDGVYN